MPLLDGLRVLDLTMWRPGPYTTQLLAQLGADVIKVEPPGGEPMRMFRSHFDLLNQHKRSIALDLKSPEDRERCLDLAAGAQVFVEGYRPGVADRLGVGYEAVRNRNPKIVYCSISGYGAEGELRDTPGHDVNYRGYSASLAPEAVSPSADDLPVADMSAATMAAFAITAACFKGEGERIDLGMADVLANWVGTVPTTAVRGAPVPAYGVYPTKDGGKITLGVVSEPALWAATCRALGLEHRVELAFADRLGRVEELDREIAAAIAAWTTGEALEALQAEGAPVAPLLTRDQMLAHPHFQERGTAQGSPIRAEKHPALPPGEVAELDQHSDEGWR
jgi:crotonobetainyl-CoA:carnitine CoA-transferase CaiB-like acyl-CoA transferase